MITLKDIGCLLIVCICVQFSACDMTRDTKVIKDDNAGDTQSISPSTKELLESYAFRVIDKIVVRAGIPRLVDENLPEGSQEFRLWAGFSHNGVKGIIIRKSSNGYSAMYIAPFDESASAISPQILSPPSDGWELLLERLESLKLLIKTDRPVEELHAHDSAAVIIEKKTASSYEAYDYQGVYSRWRETQKVEETIDILSKQFGIQMF